MSEPFIGEIKIFAGNYAIRGWAFCNGSSVNISQNTALFSILGTTFGGDGRTTFNLPNFQGNIPIGEGTGPGLSQYRIGQRGGAETTILASNNLPSHTHQAKAVNSPTSFGGDTTASDNALAQPDTNIYNSSTNLVSMESQSLASAGESQSIDNLKPYLSLNFIIALVGLYPSRS
ncbi:phage tail protein [Acaryochloris marina NIES-2412]|uniref:phage tail protein n=1 Tax=Acaryochloris marina TaxID=155978 RepID=UPI0040591562